MVMNGIERFAAELIQADKELFDRAKDDRRFRAPAIWIRVVKILFGQEHAFVAQNANDVGVGVENIFAGQFRQSRLRQYSGRDRQPAKESENCFLIRDVIVFAMAGRDVDRARAGIHGNEIRGQNHAVRGRNGCCAPMPSICRREMIQGSPTGCEAGRGAKLCDQFVRQHEGF